jgi:ABC-type transport system substrate-binding protein
VTTPLYGGTMRLIQPSSPASPIGWIGETAGESLRTAQLSIELLLRGQVDGTMLPALATSYQLNASKDTPSITFGLRKGVKFHG